MTAIDWTPEDDQTILMRRLSDASLHKFFGWPLADIHKRRSYLEELLDIREVIARPEPDPEGIAQGEPQNRKRRPWTRGENMMVLLREKTDQEIAEITGRKLNAIQAQRWRLEKGIRSV